MENKKFVLKFLLVLILTIVFTIGIKFLINKFVNVYQIEEISCCGLEIGDLAFVNPRFDSSDLKHGTVVFVGNQFSTIVTLPNEYLFTDLYTGKFGYLSKNHPLSFLASSTINQMSETEIKNLYSAIQWLDSPSFNPQISDQDLYARLYFDNNDNLDNYRAVGNLDWFDQTDYSGSFLAWSHPINEITGVYLTKISSSYSPVLWFGLFKIGFYLVLFIIIWKLPSTAQLIAKGFQKKQNIFIFLIKLFFILAILPLYLLIYILKPFEIVKRLRHGGLKELLKSVRLKPILGKAVALVLVGVIIFPIWIDGYTTVGTLVASQLGYITEDINIAGTGSMYPTWEKGTKGKSNKELAKEIVSTAGFLPYPNGIVIGGKRFLGHTLGRGDIIVWENDVTRELTSRDGAEPTGLLKRIIGLPGDTIELRDGVVYLNGEPQKEPYIAEPRSTFGGKFLKECQVVTVPQDAVFAMGDNRKGSSDSREIGFVPIKDINHVLPLEKQKGKLDKNWHDTTNDLADTAKPTIDRNRFVKLLNEKRKENGATPVKYEPKLDISAKIRGESLLNRNLIQEQASYDVVSSAMSKAGYWNSYVWEWSLEGYYTADELIEDYIERDTTDAKNVWFDKKFDDIGIGEVQGDLNGCPTQLIVIHAAGYILPNYKKEDIESWKTNLSRLKEIQPGWASLKNNSNFYQNNKNDIDRINEIISIRIANISTIITKMEANQWLTTAEQKMIDQDKTLYDEQEAIATRLNSRLNSR
ncbi:MAG TPA: signal peptidase I [Candidatus Paceibacterota bacterium]|nr:signal peptidase I [Candidatus Paceibacterota bacterium]